MQQKPRLLIISRWVEMPKGFSKILKDIYSTLKIQEEIDIIQYAFHRPVEMQDKIEDNYILTLSESSENRLYNVLKTLKPNIILCVGDTHMFNKYNNILGMSSAYKIFYGFVDGENIPFTWNKTLQYFDMIVSATEFGKKELLKSEFKDKNIRVINPPVDTAFCMPLNENKRKAYRSFLGFQDNDFLITNISINAMRKGLEYTFEYFQVLLNISSKYNKNPKLILHTKWDTRLINALKYFNIDSDSIFISNKEKTEKEILNLYQTSDLILNTSLAEGWGLPLTEALACGIPVLAPAHSGIIGAIGGELQDKKIKSKCLDNFTYNTKSSFYLYNEECPVKTYIPDTESAIKKTIPLFNNNIKKDVSKLCLDRVQFIDKNYISNQWLNLFKEILETNKNKDLNQFNIPNINFIKA